MPYRFTLPSRRTCRHLCCWLALAGAGALAHADWALQAVLQSPARTPAFAARDGWRHPLQTLEFFGIRPDWTVVEISPGAGWYSEILAPYLRDHGQLVLAGVDPQTASPAQRTTALQLQARLAARPDLYGQVRWSVFAPPDQLALVAPGTAEAPSRRPRFEQGGACAGAATQEAILRHHPGYAGERQGLSRLRHGGL